MTILKVNNYPVISSTSGIVKKGNSAAHADGQARQMYLEAFISAFAHAHNHGDNRIVTQIFDIMPKQSSYKGKVKTWIETYTPLEYSNTTKSFTVKVIDDKVKQGKWFEKAIRAAHNNPFYAKQEKVEKVFDESKELKSLETKLTKMIKTFEDHADTVDSETIESLKLMLSSFTS